MLLGHKSPICSLVAPCQATRGIASPRSRCHAGFHHGLLEAFDGYLRALVARKLTLAFFTFDEILTAAQTALYRPGSQPPPAVERVLNIGGWLAVHPEGPLWFRG